MPSVLTSFLLLPCRNLKIGYFSQHHVEQLDLNVSAVELLARKFPGVWGWGMEEEEEEGWIQVWWMPEGFRASPGTRMMGRDMF